MKQKLLVGLGLSLVLALPLLLDDQYLLHLLILAGIYIMLAVSLNLLLGFTGLFSLGHAAFYGIGAYASALLTLKAGLPFILAFPLSGLITGLIGVAIGFPALRLQGIFLAIGTLGFNEIIRLLIINWEGLTGGPAGLTSIPKPSLFNFSFSKPEYFYVSIVILVLITVVALQRMLCTRPGRALIAIRDDELAARAMGINVTRYKLFVFGLSSFIAGLAGSFFAHYMSYISAENFGLHESFAILAMVALGGMGNLFGSVAGALILTVIPEFFRFMQDYRGLTYGLTIIVIMFLLPDGILGWYAALKNKIGNPRSNRTSDNNNPADSQAGGDKTYGITGG